MVNSKVSKVLLILLISIAPAHAASHNGKNIDGRRFNCKAQIEVTQLKKPHTHFLVNKNGRCQFEGKIVHLIFPTYQGFDLEKFAQLKNKEVQNALDVHVTDIHLTVYKYNVDIQWPTNNFNMVDGI
ncbi:hypothetical protein D5018_08800 [Parashewanella curva]|uniref:Uncharacterized protein n=1 Tax=Parashewanella curva TaxID=2338552 RepID=A0A3L8PXG8_9GAMM|nr:hypothetical protein [Parashewanella curva]RLV60106.1 hypothetical protein D5018_08800 [Parashewanella curva]